MVQNIWRTPSLLILTVAQYFTFSVSGKSQWYRYLFERRNHVYPSNRGAEFSVPIQAAVFSLYEGIWKVKTLFWEAQSPTAPASHPAISLVNILLTNPGCFQEPNWQQAVDIYYVLLTMKYQGGNPERKTSLWNCLSLKA